MGEYNCELCNSVCEDILFDALIPAFNCWGVLCTKCFKSSGARLGLGKGQKYVKDAKEFVKEE